MPDAGIARRIRSDAAAWAAVQEVLREGSGLDLALYKGDCVARRLAIRLRARGAADLGAYAEILRGDPGELPRLLDTLTVSVTQFFRDPGTFQVLQETVLPGLCRARAGAGRRVLRAWSAGCASGEEAYTVAILFQEVWRTLGLRQAAIIYATDVSARCLERARAGRYAVRQLRGMPPEVQVRYFAQEEEGWVRLVPSVRRMVSVKRHDLRTLPPFRRLDLILSRNVLIYLAPAFQQRVLQTFAEALNPGGILVLGRVEGLSGSAQEAFEPVVAVERIYRRRASAARGGEEAWSVGAPA